MAGRTYERLGIEVFGAHLIEHEDLDPVYLALTRTGLDFDWTLRFLVAYWCSYHVGFSCFAADHPAPDYWDVMRAWAVNDTEAPAGGRWPRGHERRHARGNSGLTMVRKLEERYPEPEQAASTLACLGHDGVLPCKAVMKTVKEEYLFGDWIAFKVADMAYNVLDVAIDFDEAAVFMFKDPRKGAKLFWRGEMIKAGALTAELAKTAEPKDEMAMIHGVVKHLIEVFDGHLAPPKRERPVGVLEVETVLCKWKSHLNGHYPLFNDIDEIHEGLVPWSAVSESAVAFADAMPGQERRNA